MAESAGAQGPQPEIEIALFQMKQLEQSITQLQARVASLKAIGASVDRSEDLLRVLQRSHESLRRFLVRAIPPKKA
jgi:prefoldin subunit 5